MPCARDRVSIITHLIFLAFVSVIPNLCRAQSNFSVLETEEYIKSRVLQNFCNCGNWDTNKASIKIRFWNYTKDGQVVSAPTLEYTTSYWDEYVGGTSEGTSFTEIVNLGLVKEIDFKEGKYNTQWLWIDCGEDKCIEAYQVHFKNGQIIYGGDRVRVGGVMPNRFAINDIVTARRLNKAFTHLMSLVPQSGPPPDPFD